jgi:hypothetical protein
MIGARREFCGHTLALQTEFDLQACGVVGTTRKTHGCGLDVRLIIQQALRFVQLKNQ